ncbi:proline dehydrogenase [bacterium]|nr:MAG: proline dehydrogenase [bacterium]
MTLVERAIANPRFQERYFFLAKRFVAGETEDAAIQVVQRLNADGLAVTLDYLGEDVFEAKEAQTACRHALQTLEAIAQAGVDANLSVKLTALGLSIDEEVAERNLVEIAKCASRNSDPFVRIDMESSNVVDATLRVFGRVYPVHRNVGIVLQAYLRRTEQDIDRAIDLGARVRLVKGAYKESAALAYQRMPDIRRQFLSCAQKLLVRGCYPAIATHDLSLIDAVKSMATDCGVAKDHFEFQLLYGIRPETQRRLAREGYRVRVYVPFGTHWSGYFYRRLAERKENVLFVLQSLFAR